MAGNGCNAGWSSSANNAAREPGSFWKGRSLSDVEFPADGGVEFGQAEEPLITQHGQDAAFGVLDGRFHLGLVLRFAGAGR